MDLLADLNEPQRQAVCHMDGPLLVLAGAGSGKTRVITRRVAYLISRGVPPRNILAVTFTNKAADEMRRRVLELQAPPGATVATFHALCARLLREFAQPAGLSRDYGIFDRDDQLRLAKRAVEALDLPGAPAAAEALAAISRAKNALQGPGAFAEQADTPYHRAVAEVYREYEKLLAAHTALDFDDLLLRTACLLRDRPDIRELLGQRFRYILIDEYQDTNHAQYVIAHGIALDYENIAVTGDPDQSIYAWRGADIGNILEFENDYPNAVVVRLEENYRSTPPILAAASRLIAHNARRKRKDLWTRRPGGADVRVVRLDGEHAEARYVASRIAEGLRSGGETAVFYRVNALSRVLEEAMLKAGIAYRVARGVEFYNRKEIKDVVAYLRLLVNPADDLSCRRIINTPPRGIGQATVDRLAQFAASAAVPLLEACRRADQAHLGPGPAKKVAAFVAVRDDLSKEVDQPVGRIVEQTMRRSGLEQALVADEEGRQMRANVDELITAATEFDAAEGGSLADFLQRVSLVSDAEHLEGSGAVTLMTLHAAKGLEFDQVFLVGCEDGLLPFRRSGGEARPTSWRTMPRDDLEEERRLAFVGMTRARDQLVLTAVTRRMLRGQTTSQSPSPFLGELDGEGVTVEDATTPPVELPRRGRSAARRGGFYADVDERATIEALEAAAAVPPEYEYLKVGCWVHSPRFGDGRVVKLANSWPDTRVVVDFTEHRRKTLVLRLAQLEVTGDRPG